MKQHRRDPAIHDILTAVARRLEMQHPQPGVFNDMRETLGGASAQTVLALRAGLAGRARTQGSGHAPADPGQGDGISAAAAGSETCPECRVTGAGISSGEPVPARHLRVVE